MKISKIKRDYFDISIICISILMLIYYFFTLLFKEIKISLPPPSFSNFSLDDFHWKMKDKYSEDCRKHVQKDFVYCLMSSKDSLEIALFGDSHANKLFYGISRIFENKGLIHIGTGGCIPLFGMDTNKINWKIKNGYCLENTNYAINYMLASKSIKKIIISMSWVRNMYGTSIFNKNVPPKIVKWKGLENKADEYSLNTIFLPAIEETITKMISSGKEVILFLDWPELDFDPLIDCFKKSKRKFFLDQKLSQCAGISRSKYEKSIRKYKEDLYNLKMKFKELIIFDPTPYICDEIWCRTSFKNRFSYLDHTHINKIGSEYLGQKFYEYLQNLR